jgi:hypothetical protein
MPPPPGEYPETPRGGYQPGPPQFPAGYQPYGGGFQQGMQPAGPPRNNGLSIAGFVLSLVNVIPCFWVFPLPAILGIVFGFVGKGQINADPHGQRGKGMAIAAIVVGIVFVLIAVAFWIWVASSDNCYRDGSSFHCYSN